MRGPARLTLAGLLVTGSVLAACSDEGDSQAFCDRVGTTPAVAEILAELDTSDPGGSRRRLQQGVEDFRSLESSAPGEIRADLARLRQGVELVLQAVEENPDDLPAARQAIAQRRDQLTGLVQAGERVVSYARDECGISLDDPTGAGDDLTPEPTTASAPPEGGQDPDATAPGDTAPDSAGDGG